MIRSSSNWRPRSESSFVLLVGVGCAVAYVFRWSANYFLVIIWWAFWRGWARFLFDSFFDDSVGVLHCDVDEIDTHGIVFTLISTY